MGKSIEMRNIYERFPALELISGNEATYPEVLPFICTTKGDLDFINTSLSFADLFVGFNPDSKEASHTIGNRTEVFNYVISEKLFEHFKFKRRLSPSNFIQYLKKDVNWFGGVVVADIHQGLHYVYQIRNLGETKAEKEASGVYFAVGYFKNSTFLGFEDGYMDHEGEVELISGIYDDDTPLHGYLYFIGALMRHLERFKMARDLPEDMGITSGDFKYVVLDDSEM
jgi:hypothetical protein